MNDRCEQCGGQDNTSNIWTYQKETLSQIELHDTLKTSYCEREWFASQCQFSLDVALSHIVKSNTDILPKRISWTFYSLFRFSNPAAGFQVKESDVSSRVTWWRLQTQVSSLLLVWITRGGEACIPALGVNTAHWLLFSWTLFFICMDCCCCSCSVAST